MTSRGDGDSGLLVAEADSAVAASAASEADGDSAAAAAAGGAAQFSPRTLVTTRRLIFLPYCFFPLYFHFIYCSKCKKVCEGEFGGCWVCCVGLR
jgi:hypothetical protein